MLASGATQIEIFCPSVARAERHHRMHRLRSRRCPIGRQRARTQAGLTGIATNRTLAIPIGAFGKTSRR